MRTPLTFLQLIDLMLEKRDVKRDGVDGYNTVIKLEYPEVRDRVCDSKERVKKILEIMDQEKVFVEVNGKLAEVKLFDHFEIKEDFGIIVWGSSTIKLVSYKNQIQKDHKKSMMELKGRIVIFRNKEKKFSKSARYYVYNALYSNFLTKLTYQDLFDVLIERGEDFGIRQAEEQRKKNIQDVVDGLRSELIEKLELPEDPFKNYPGEFQEGGYALII